MSKMGTRSRSVGCLFKWCIAIKKGSKLKLVGSTRTASIVVIRRSWIVLHNTAGEVPKWPENLSLFCFVFALLIHCTVQLTNDEPFMRGSEGLNTTRLLSSDETLPVSAIVVIVDCCCYSKRTFKRKFHSNPNKRKFKQESGIFKEEIEKSKQELTKSISR